MDTNYQLKILGNQKGFAIIWLALLFPVILLFAAMSIDFGYMYMAKGQLQNAADSAALAAAGKLADSGPNFDPVTVTQAAQDFALANKSADKNVEIKPTDVVFGHWTSIPISPNPKFQEGVTPYNAVKVTASRTADSLGNQVPIFFGKYFGWTKMSASARAVAKAGNYYATPPIILCINATTLTGNNFFDLNPTTQDITYKFGSAWTTFETAQSSTSTSTVRTYLESGINLKDDLCQKPCIAGTQGTQGNPESGSSLGSLNTVFNASKAWYQEYPSGPSWRVVIPIVDGVCSSTTCNNSPPTSCTYSGNGCPPGNDPGALHHISGWAVAYITEVVAIGGQKGYRATIQQYLPCSGPPPFDFLGRRQKLVDF